MPINGKAIRKKRREIDMTQNELAEKIGRSLSFISKIESNVIGDCRLSDIVNISETLNMEVKEMYNQGGFRKDA